jgi:hypothetical protein
MCDYGLDGDRTMSAIEQRFDTNNVKHLSCALRWRMSPTRTGHVLSEMRSYAAS